MRSLVLWLGPARGQHAAVVVAGARANPTVLRNQAMTLRTMVQKQEKKMEVRSLAASFLPRPLSELFFGKSAAPATPTESQEPAQGVSVLPQAQAASTSTTADLAPASVAAREAPATPPPPSFEPPSAPLKAPPQRFSQPSHGNESERRSSQPSRGHKFEKLFKIHENNTVRLVPFDEFKAWMQAEGKWVDKTAPTPRTDLSAPLLSHASSSSSSSPRKATPVQAKASESLDTRRIQPVLDLASSFLPSEKLQPIAMAEPKLKLVKGKALRDPAMLKAEPNKAKLTKPDAMHNVDPPTTEVKPNVVARLAEAKPKSSHPKTLRSSVPQSADLPSADLVEAKPKSSTQPRTTLNLVPQSAEVKQEVVKSAEAKSTEAMAKSSTQPRMTLNLVPQPAEVKPEVVKSSGAKAEGSTLELAKLAQTTQNLVASSSETKREMVSFIAPAPPSLISSPEKSAIQTPSPVVSFGLEEQYAPKPQKGPSDVKSKSAERSTPQVPPASPSITIDEMVMPPTRARSATSEEASSTTPSSNRSTHAPGPSLSGAVDVEPKLSAAVPPTKRSPSSLKDKRVPLSLRNNAAMAAKDKKLLQLQRRMARPRIKKNTVHKVVLPDRETFTLKELADCSGLSSENLLKMLVVLGAADARLITLRVMDMVSGNRRKNRKEINAVTEVTEVPGDMAELLLLECGVSEVVRNERMFDDRSQRSVATATTPTRAPIVCVMGHVDHGKTTLLDALRNTNVVDAEQGGITQTIAAFRVNLKNGMTACFLDTPGHEAFASMRQSGTSVTDVAVIAIAATDGVMPQTLESISYARAAGIPIVFAITKVDLATGSRGKNGSADEDSVKNAVLDQLNLHGVYNENDLFVPVVAPQKRGLEELIESVLLQVEMNSEANLSKAVVNAPAEAVVLESKMDRALGSVADIVVRWGTLKTGDYVVCGTQFGRVRRMLDVNGKVITSCPPATPARISGFDTLPTPGTDVFVLKDEKECKRVVNVRLEKEAYLREKGQRLSSLKDKSTKQMQLVERKRAMAEAAGGGGNPSSIFGAFRKPRLTRLSRLVKKRDLESERVAKAKSEDERRANEVRVILKADTEGSLLAVNFSLQKAKHKLPDDGVLKVVRSSVGAITESDLEFAKMTDATILGFNVKQSGSVSKHATKINVKVFTHPVIYNLVDDFYASVAVKAAEEVEEEVKVEKVKARAQVMEVFEIKGKEKRVVAGIRVLEGVMLQGDVMTVLREGKVIAEGKSVESLRKLKETVNSVEKGHEGGISLENFTDFKAGDIIESRSKSSS